MPKLGQNHVDRKRLKQVAGDLVCALEQERSIRGALRLKRSFKPEVSWSGGWRVTAATMGPGLPRIEVFFDRYAGGTERHFWFGFASEKNTPVAQAVDACDIAVSRRIGDDDVEKAKGGYYHLKRPPSKQASTLPILESYPAEKEFYFGMYDLAPTSNSLERAVYFLKPIVNKLSQTDIGKIEKDEYAFFRRLSRDRQRKFRKSVLGAYGGECAVTGCGIERCLEATHLDRYADTQDNRVSNGILLRADLHRLLDAGLLIFQWDNGQVYAMLHKSIRLEMYKELHQKQIRLPDKEAYRPSKESINRHACRFSSDGAWS